MSEHEQSNVINSTDAKRWVGEIERLDEEILSIKMRNAAEVKAVKDRKSSCFGRAEAAGIPMEALKLELFRREQARKVKDRESEAGFDRVEIADMIREVLGDFASSPLGGAAVEAAAKAPKAKAKGRGRPKKGAPLVGEDTGEPPHTGADDEPDLRSARQKEQEAQRKADAEERLAGMKTLDESVTTH